MSFLFRSVSRLFLRPASSTPAQFDDIDDLPPRLRAIVTSRYAALPEHLDEAPGSPHAHDPTSTTGSASPFSPYSPSSLPDSLSEDTIAVLDLSSPTTPPNNAEPTSDERPHLLRLLPEHPNNTYSVSPSVHNETDNLLSTEDMSNNPFSFSSNTEPGHQAAFESHKVSTSESNLAQEDSPETARNRPNAFGDPVSHRQENEGLTDALSDDSDEFTDALCEVFPDDELDFQPNHTTNYSELDIDDSFQTLMKTTQDGTPVLRSVTLLETIGQISSSLSNYKEEIKLTNNEKVSSISEYGNPTRLENDARRPIFEFLSERVTAVNALILEHKAPQVVLYACGESALMWLHTPPPPPVTLFAVDDKETRQQLTPGVVPFLPSNVRVKQVRTKLEDQTWDSELVERGFDWCLSSAWVVHIDLASKHISSFSAFDSFLRNVHRLTTAQSTIIVAYPVPSSHPADDPYAVSFSSSDFSIFVRRRSFRVLSDRHLDASFQQKLRIAALAHGKSELSDLTSQLMTLESSYSSSEEDCDSKNVGFEETNASGPNNSGSTSNEDVASDEHFEALNVGGSDDNAGSGGVCSGKAGRKKALCGDTDMSTEGTTDSDVVTSSEALCESKQKVDPMLRTLQFRLSVGSMPEEAIRWSLAAVVIGSDSVLGCWNPQQAVKMKGDMFDRGSTLLADVDVRVDAGRFEYKYALINAENWVVAWEAGANRVIEDIHRFSINEDHVYNEVWRY